MDIQAVDISVRAIQTCGAPCQIGTPFMAGNILHFIIIFGAITFLLWYLKRCPELA